MNRLTAAWGRWWFRDGSPYDLAAARIVFSLQALWVLLSRDFAGVSDLPAVYWRFVPPSARWRFLLFPGQGDLERLLTGLAVAALIAAALGLAPRVSLLASALLLYHLAPLETIIWTTNAMERGFEVAILALTVLAFSPCADVWSVWRRAGPPPAPGWQYHWPLLLVQIFVVEIYLLAGFHKLQHAGLAWAGADNQRSWLLALSIYAPVSVHTALARFLADRPLLCLLIGAGTLVLELTFAVVLFVRRARAIWIPVAVALHVGIVFSLNIVFLNTPQLLAFVNWDWLRAKVARRAPPDAVGAPAS